MLSAQAGVCAICQQIDRDVDKRTGKNRSLAVDHCHTTDKIRGLLCGDCNRALGLMKENSGAIMNMIRYLASHHKLKLVG